MWLTDHGTEDTHLLDSCESMKTFQTQALMLRHAAASGPVR
jgi:hypothetical protein